MTNPTSNFGWQMPTSTDLVTDLPADFEVFGQAVDTSLADLKGGTSGQILSKASNTDMDFTWITNDVGDITAVNVTAPITGGGTSGAVTIGVDAASTSAAGVVQLSDSTSTTSSVLASTPTATKAAYDLANTASTTATAAIPKSTVTTAGDVIYATGSGAVTRLGIGTVGQVLTVNGGGTAPSWATASSGGMTLLSTTSLSGSSTSVTGISGSYQNLFVEVIDFYSSSSALLEMRFNSDSTANAYQFITNYYAADNAGPQQAPYLDKTTLIYLTYGGVSAADNNNYASITIPNYASTTVKKTYSGSTQFVNAGGNNAVNVISGAWFNSGAISSVQVITSAGTFSSGSVKIWGVK